MGAGTDSERQGVQEQERKPSGHSLPSPALLLFSGNTLKGGILSGRH